MNTTTTSEMGKTAGGYALCHNWRVLPLHEMAAPGVCSCPDGAACTSKAKHPRTKHGLKDGTTDPAQIRAWWERWPTANIGVVTGPESGVLMIGPDGEQGLADLAELEAELGPLPETATAASGSGGMHICLRFPDDGQPVPNRKNHRGTKIDVRGTGGYFVAPGSENENGPYTWIDDRTELAEAPPALVEWARKPTNVEDDPPPPRNGFTATASSSKPTEVTERAKKYLAKCAPAIAGQRGHDRLMYAARAVVYGFNLGQEAGFDLLAEAYNPACQPPWSEKEIRHKCKEADTKPYKKPRGWLLDSSKFDSHTARNCHNPGPSSNGKHHAPGGTDKPGSNSGDFRDGFPEEWRQPAPLPDMPPVPAFPIEVFPPQVADYWLASAESLAVPVDLVGAIGAAMLGGAAGRARGVGIKKQYVEYPCLWVAAVSPPGSTKSAALRAACGPISETERKWLAEHRTKILEFSADEERYKQDYKAWKEGGCEGPPPDKPKAPTLRQATLENTTTEAAALVMNDNPKGVTLTLDEMDGWVLGMNQYRSGGKGNDKQFWLSAWAGARAKYNRKGSHADGPLVVENPFAAVAGMMTPASLPNIRGGWRRGEPTAEDGFPDRFLWSFPDPLPATGERWREVPDELVDGYANVMQALLALEMVPTDTGGCRPYIVPLAESARDVYQQFTQAIADRMNTFDPFDHYRGVLSKLRGYGGRLAIMLWCVRHACGDAYGSDPVTADMVSGAATLIDYFEAHARRCLGAGWADRQHRVAKRVLAWLLRHPDKMAFNRSEAFLQLKDRRDVTSGDHLTEPLKVLADHGYIRPIDPTGNNRPGPVPDLFAVNPIWPRTVQTRP